MSILHTCLFTHAISLTNTSPCHVKWFFFFINKIEYEEAKPAKLHLKGMSTPTLHILYFNGTNSTMSLCLPSFFSGSSQLKKTHKMFLAEFLYSFFSRKKKMEAWILLLMHADNASVRNCISHLVYNTRTVMRSCSCFSFLNPTS